MSNIKIKTRAWVHMGGELVDVDTLAPEDRKRLADALAVAYFNALYAGRAKFRIEGEGHGDTEEA